MKTFRTLIMVLLMSVIGIQPVPAAGQNDYGSVGISPTYQELPVGGIADFTVAASSSSGGSVIVNIPTGLDLLGSPACYSGCRVPMVTYGTDGTTIEFNLDGQIASMGIQVAVSYLVAPGSSLSIGVMLVGGPQAVEMSFASIAVVEALPTSPVVPVDEKYASLNVTPRHVMTAPGGTWTYFVQLSLWGDWSGQLTDQEVKVTIPAPLQLTADPICGPRASVLPTQSTCVVTAVEMESQTIVTANPSAMSDRGDGVYVSLRLDAAATADLDLTVDVEMILKNGVERVAKDSQAVNVTSGGSPFSGLVAPTTVQALLEVRESYISSSSLCISDLATPGQMVGIYEWGGEYPLATSTISTGRVAPSTDLPNDESCYFSVRFEVLDDFDVYSVAQIQSEFDFPCRACYFGIVTKGSESIQVFTLDLMN